MLIRHPVRVMSLLAAAFVAAHVSAVLGAELFGFSRTSGVLRQLDLNAEANLTAWYASFLLLACATVVLGLVLASQSRSPRLTRRWGVLAGGLLLMAIDETAQIHDLATGPLRRGLDLDFGLFYFAWLLPAVAILVAATLYLTPLAVSLDVRLRAQVVVAAAVYFAGAVGLEMLSGILVENGRDSGVYYASTTLEETLELVGTLLFLRAVTTALGEGAPTFRLDFVSETRAEMTVGT